MTVTFLIAYGGFRTGAKFIAGDVNSFIRDYLGGFGAFVARQDSGSLALATGLVGAVAMFFIGREPRPRTPKSHGLLVDLSVGDPEEPPVADASDRSYLDETADDLAGVFRKRTTAQAQELVRPFIGEWMRVEGSVWDVEVGAETCRVQLEETPQMTGVFLIFEPAWTNRLIVLIPGTRISAVGRVVEVSSHYVELEECELEGIVL